MLVLCSIIFCRIGIQNVQECDATEAKLKAYCLVHKLSFPNSSHPQFPTINVLP
ncbi:MAG: hypothetical protein JWR72_2622 [Flavisolibacter sp.]|nr:hypothetical protein [Flavisolibacter sp.]